MSDLARATSAEAAGARLVLVPVGSIEQHGPHLPLDTDTVIATAVAEGVAAELAPTVDDVWVAPAIAYGSSGEHQSWAGTSSTGTAALTHVAVELTRSMRTWADRVVLVNAHGGNVEALSASDEVALVFESLGSGLLQAEKQAVTRIPCPACAPPALVVREARFNIIRQFTAEERRQYRIDD